MLPLSAFVFIRTEIKKIDVTLVQRIVRGVMMGIIISMIIVSPFSMSGFYWPAVLANSDNSTASVADSSPPYTNGTSTTEDTTSSLAQQTNSTEDSSPPNTNGTATVESSTSSSGNTTASVADSSPPYTNGTSTTEDTTSSLAQQTNSTEDSSPPNTNGTATVESSTSSSGNTTASVADSSPPYTNGTSTTEDTTSSLAQQTNSTEDSSPPNTNGTATVESSTSSSGNTTASVADSSPPYTNGTSTTEDTTSFSNVTSSDYNGTSTAYNGTDTEYNATSTNATTTESIPVNGTTVPVIVPNATETWEFDNNVNGSQFIGTVSETNSTLVVEGEGYVAGDGNYTSNLVDLSITAWVKPNYTGGSAQYSVVSKENSFILSINNNLEPQKIATFSIFDGIKWHSVETTTRIGQDWSHIAATFNGTLMSIYANGTISNTLATEDTTIVNAEGSLEPAVPALVNSTSDVVIGASLDNIRGADDVEKQFRGKIDGVNIYQVYLTAAEIYEIYSRSLVQYSEPSSEESSVETLIAKEPLVEYSMENVTKSTTEKATMLGNYTELNDELSQIAVSAWVKPDYSAGDAEFAVLGKEDSFILSINNNLEPKQIAQFSVFNGMTWSSVVGVGPIFDGKWTHLVAMVDGNVLSLYQNGVLTRTTLLDESFALTSNGLVTIPADIATSNTEVIIGAYGDNTRGTFSISKLFNGEIDDVLIYSRTLSQEEITDLYSSNKYSIPPIIQDVAAVKSYELEHDNITIGKPVTWTQQVTLDNETNSLAIEVPADAQNIQVESVKEDSTRTFVADSQEQIITEETIVKTSSNKTTIVLKEETVVPVAELKEKPELVENNTDTKLIVVNNTAIEYNLTFETEAPYTIEEEQITYDKYNKTVTVAHNSTLHYSNVKSYSDIPEDWVIQGAEFSLYWNINGTKTDVTHDPRFQVEYVDTDDNGIADQMQWIVPQLSQQQFEIVGKANQLSKSLLMHQSKYGAFSPKISTKILDVFTDVEPSLAAQRAGLSYQENKVHAYIYLDENESLANIPPNIIVSAAEGRIAAAKLTIDEMEQLAQQDYVVRIGTPEKRVLLDHDVGEGVAFTLADQFLNAGIDGSGVTVAVIDGDFFPTNPEIIGNVVSATLYDNGGNCGGSISCGASVGDSHGTAVAEIITDMAPGVNLRLYTIWDVIDFNMAVQDAMDNNVDVITASLGFNTGGDGVGPNGHWFRGGASDVARKIDEARSQGILATLSAGNDAQVHWMGQYVPSTVLPTDIGIAGYQSLMEFQPGETGLQKVCLPVTNVGNFLYFTSWNAWDLTNEDYDIFLFEDPPTVANPVAGSIDFQDPGIPWEGFIGPDEIDPMTNGQNGCLVLASFLSSQNHFFHIFTDGHVIDPSLRVNAGSLTTPADAVGAVAVGAIRAANPNVQTQIDDLEPFSSQGPTDDNRPKPEICGPDGNLSHQDGTPGLDPFFGTSAAAPHVAGAAALLLSQDPGLSTKNLEDKLADTARNNPSYSINNLCGANSGALQLPEIAAENSATGSGSVAISPDVGQVASLVAVNEGTLPTSGKPIGLQFQHGFYDWTITGLTPGQTITLTMTYPEPILVGSEYWQYDGANWVDLTSLLGSNDGDQTLTLTITDGGLGDTDGMADGQISDPGGPGEPVFTANAGPDQVADELTLVTLDGSATSGGETPYTFAWTQLDGVPTTPVLAEMLFDGNLDVTPSYLGTSGGGTGTFVPGQFGAAYEFDGSSSSAINVLPSPSSGILFPRNSLSLTGWLYLPPTSGSDKFVVDVDGSGGCSNNPYQISYRNGGSFDELRFTIDTTGGIFNFDHSLTANNQWLHYAMTWDVSSNMQLYIDGNLLGGIPAGNEPLEQCDNGSLVLGRGAGGGTDLPAGSRIDSFRVHHEKLTQQQVTDLYQSDLLNSQSATFLETLFDNDDLSINSPFSTSGGGSLTFVDGPVGRAVEFDGTSFFSVPDNSQFDDEVLSIEKAVSFTGWLYLPPNTGGDDFIFSKGPGNGGNDYPYSFEHLSDNNLAAQIRVGGSGGFTNAVGTSTPPPLNTWFHYAITWSQGSQQLKLYINGQEVDSNPTGTPGSGIIEDYTDALGIGAQAQGTNNPLDAGAKLDQFRIHKSELTPAQIQTLYQNEAPAVTLSDPNNVQPTFTAPDIVVDREIIFELEATDAVFDVDTDTVGITVQLPPPDAVDDTLGTFKNVPHDLEVLFNDDESGGGALTITAFDASTTQGGTVSDNGDGTLLYTPPLDFESSTDTFTYEVTNSFGSDTATVTVNVLPIYEATITTVPNPDPQNNENFGFSVFTRGDQFGSFVVVGAPFETTNNGAVYRYDRGGTLLQTIPNPTGTADQFGKSVSYSIFGGDRIIVGAPGYDPGAAPFTGRAYMFGTTSSTPLATLENPIPASSFDNFGHAVAMDRSEFIVTAPFDDTTGTGHGQAYDYFSSCPTCGPETVYQNPTASNEGLGFSVATEFVSSWNFYVLGADQADTGGITNAGEVHYYSNLCESNSSSGTPPICDIPNTTILNPTPETNDRFGISVDLDEANGHILIGAENDSTAGPNAGAAYLYDTTGTLLQTYLNPTPGSQEFFGSSVSIEDGVVLISAREDNASFDDSGVVYVYDTLGNLQTAILNPSPATNDRFGSSIHYRNELLVIGAERDDNGATDTGAVYLVDFNTSPVATDDDFFMLENQSTLPIDVLFNDFHPEGDPISITTAFPINTALSGTVTDNGDNTQTYTPPGGFSATDVDSFIYEITDGSLTDTATVTIESLAIEPATGFEDTINLSNSVHDAQISAIDAEGTLMGAVWVETTGSESVLASLSQDGGTTWSAPQVIENIPGFSFIVFVDIIIQNNVAHLLYVVDTYTDDTFTTLVISELKYSRSIGGAAFDAHNTIRSSGTTFVDGFMTADDSFVYIASHETDRIIGTGGTVDIDRRANSDMTGTYDLILTSNEVAFADIPFIAVDNGVLFLMYGDGGPGIPEIILETSFDADQPTPSFSDLDILFSDPAMIPLAQAEVFPSDLDAYNGAVWATWVYDAFGGTLFTETYLGVVEVVGGTAISTPINTRIAGTNSGFNDLEHYHAFLSADTLAGTGNIGYVFTDTGPNDDTQPNMYLFNKCNTSLVCTSNFVDSTLTDPFDGWGHDIDSEGNHVVLSWVSDHSVNPTEPVVRVGTSIDGGATAFTKTEVSNPEATFSFSNRVALSSTHVAWIDDSAGDFEVFVRSTGVKIWDGGGNGIDWNDATNWSPDGVPDQFDDAIIPVGNTVTIDSPGANVRSITNDAQLTLDAGQTLTFSASSLTGTGTLTMSSGSSIEVQNSGDTLTHGEFHTIEGQGNILQGIGNLDNQGSIIANSNTNTLTISPEFSVTNSGPIGATNGGILEISSGTWTNAGTGSITSTDNGSVVNVNNGATIINNVLGSNPSDSSIVNLGSNAKIQDLTLTGIVRTVSSATTLTQGTITNNANWVLIDINSGISFTDSTPTIDGTGTITMNGGAITFTGGSSQVFTQGSSHVIQGYGQLLQGIGSIVNDGGILANSNGNALQIEPGPGSGTVTNSGTIQASNVGTLDMIGGTWTNTGSGIVASTNNGSVVNVNNAKVIGNILRSNVIDSSIVNLVSNAELQDITLEGTIVTTSGTTNIQGTITNNAAWTINSILNIDADNTTLQGTGTVTMSSGTNINYGSPTYTFIHGADHTIQGEGTIGSGSGVLDNQGDILANVAGQILQLSVGFSSPNPNTGTMSASNDGVLELDSGEWDNTGIWTAQTSGTGITLQDVESINTDTLFAVGNGGTILQTVDGGATWNAQSSGTSNDLLGISLVDSNTAFTVGSAGTILKTTDGGLNWNPQNSGTIENLRDVSVVDANTVFVVGDTGTILKTTDGGSNWATQMTPTSNRLWDISAVDANTAWAVGDSDTILYTTDGGSLWSTQSSGTSGQDMHGVFTFDINAAWIVGDTGTILETTNAGGTWVPRTSGTSSNLLSIKFIDENTAFIVGNTGTILHSIDGGATWNAQTSGTSDNLENISYVNEGYTAYAVGASGTILKKADGTIDSDGSSTVNVNSATVTGGTLGAIGGTVNLQFTTNLNGPITLEGTVNTIGGTTNIDGTITNNAVWTINSILNIDADDTTLQGTGTVTMSSGTNINYGSPTYTFIHGADHTIQGEGTIGSGSGVLDNQGEILANVAGQILQLSVGFSSPNPNTGTMSASNDGVLELDSGEWDNTGGVIDSDGSSTVNVNSATVTGGTLGAIGGTVNLQFTTNLNGPITLEGTVNTSGGTTNIDGTITNNAAWTLVDSSSSVALASASTVTIAGTGSITVNGGNLGTGSGTLINGPNHTITGGGFITSGPATFTNQGTVLVENSNTLSMGGTTPSSNTGLIQVDISGVLDLPISLGNSGTIESCGTILGTVTGNAVVEQLCPDNIVVIDSQGGTQRGLLFRVDPTNGFRTIISDFNNAAQGPLGEIVSGVAIEQAAGTILVTDLDYNGGSPGPGPGALFRVNPSDGSRTILHDFGSGVAPFGASPWDVEASLGKIYVVDGDTNTGAGTVGAIFEINPTTGARTLVHDFGSGGAPTAASPTGIAIEQDGDILVVDALAGTGALGMLFRIDGSSFTRTALSDFGDMGDGPLGIDPSKVTVASNGEIFVTDMNAGLFPDNDGVLFQVDETTGVRKVVDDFNSGSPALEDPGGLDEDNNGNIVFADAHAGSSALGAVVGVTPSPLLRFAISDFGLLGTGPLGEDPIDLEVVQDVVQTCELNIFGDMNYGNQGPLLGPGIEKTINLSNGQVLDTVVSVYGTDWNDGAGAAEVDVGQTRFSLVSNPLDYGNKTPLPLISSPAGLTTVNSGTNVDTFWQLDVVLNPGSETFTGNVDQTVTFEFACS